MGTVPFNLKARWLSRWWLLLVPLGGIPWFIAVRIFSRRSRFEMWLCDRHAREIKRGRLIGWAGVALFLVSTFTPTSTFVAAALTTIGWIAGGVIALFGYYSQRTVSIARIDRSYIWLGLVSPMVRETLPPLGPARAR